MCEGKLIAKVSVTNNLCQRNIVGGKQAIFVLTNVEEAKHHLGIFNKYENPNVLITWLILSKIYWSIFPKITA